MGKNNRFSEETNEKARMRYLIWPSARAIYFILGEVLLVLMICVIVVIYLVRIDIPMPSVLYPVFCLVCVRFNLKKGVFLVLTQFTIIQSLVFFKDWLLATSSNLYSIY